MKRYLKLILLLLLFATGQNIIAQNKVTPKNGEGIDAFLIRNKRSPKKYKTIFIEINKGKFGKNNSLLKGVAYKIPPVNKELPDKITEPLFGPKLNDVKIKPSTLTDACFYIVSGHGGPDPGAIGKLNDHELHEDEYAYDIALRLARNLMEEGAKVYIIIQDSKDGIRDSKYLSTSKRETCMGQTIPLNQNQRLIQRSEKINSLYAKDKNNYKYCRAIFLHIDSRSKKKQMDVFFYHQNENSTSKKLATRIRNTFEQKYKKFQPGRGFDGTVSPRNLLVLKRTKPTSVFVELGNIQNSNDQRRFVISDNRQALANWITDGFIADFKAVCK